MYGHFVSQVNWKKKREYKTEKEVKKKGIYLP